MLREIEQYELKFTSLAPSDVLLNVEGEVLTGQTD